jgi:hypothetical protein
VFANARAPTLSAYALFSIVGALLADRRHLQVLCASGCFLQTSRSQRETARSVKHLLEAARSAKREASANEHKALVKCAGLWAEERNVFWGFYFEEIFYGFEGQKVLEGDASLEAPWSMVLREPEVQKSVDSPFPSGRGG